MTHPVYYLFFELLDLYNITYIYLYRSWCYSLVFDTLISWWIRFVYCELIGRDMYLNMLLMHKKQVNSAISEKGKYKKELNVKLKNALVYRVFHYFELNSTRLSAF